MEAHLAQLRAQMARADEIISCLYALRGDATEEEHMLLDKCLRRMTRVERTLSCLRDALSEHNETVTNYRRQLSHELDALEWDIHMLF